VTGRWFSPGPPVSSINKTDRHDITEILLKVALKQAKLEVKETTDTASSASFLDLYLEFDDSGQLSTKIYDKRDDFNFKIINFPNMCSNIPASPAYVVYISQLIRYARASSNYSDFLKRHLHLRNRLLDQGYKKIRLIRSLNKFIFRYQDLVEIYSVSPMNLLIFYKLLKKLRLIKINRLEEGHNLYPLVCRRPAETVSLQRRQICYR
jgi:predicted O-linked N-acetylglucosamine transferase (SPINDLY family)